MAAEGYSAEELARDGSHPRRMLGNAWTNLCDINRSDLTSREAKRLSTIMGKIDDLEEIIEEREVSERREELAPE